MLPLFTLFNDADVRLTNTVHFCKFGLSPSNQVSDFKNLMCFQSGIYDRFASSISSLASTVRHIVRVCSYKHMRGIYTCSLFASGTIMAKLYIIWKWTNQKFPNRTVRLHNLLFGVIPAMPVSLCFTPGPQPAGIGFINFPPNPVWETSPTFQTFVGAKLPPLFGVNRIFAMLANGWNLGIYSVRHNESLSFCLGGSEGLGSFRTADILCSKMI